MAMVVTIVMTMVVMVWLDDGSGGMTIELAV